mmetsp:Transcript_4102/g.4752  ORF Transcript_4102/g.4752 Transcript_4102/m.4752 type:complete len:586 (-) Transcript_4102:36-1793(-)|eukprot:CAMPEP_0194161158 /NCGR_PEP_ID=MMETSP0152-20130528/78785_1 /TAXON_ID=1049557 /ORGANISM="Thalassiothrix antarctica, Strain L6-D1" /LENGTH=585 /DNA_ID=CAMNT_0038870915 /DNA_START=21 /DNA_END=1778 /DNA_ORIENTATION=-
MTNNSNVSSKRRSRWGDMPEENEKLDTKAKALALKESVAARLAALKARKANNANKRSAPTEKITDQLPVKKAKNFELDMNVIGPTYQSNVPIQKPKINPYLAYKEEEKEEADLDNLDETIVRACKPRERNKVLNFVEPGTFVEIAERKRQKAVNASQSGFFSGRKAGTYIQSAGMADIYGGSGFDMEEYDEKMGNLPPRTDCGDPGNMPLFMEWWDTEFLPSKLRKQVQIEESEALTRKSKRKLQLLGRSKAKKESNTNDNLKDGVKEEQPKLMISTCFDQAALSYSKTAALVQHIVPIGAPKRQREAAQPTLYLTKKELKRQRKLRRAEKQRELQDMQAAGLVKAPEPKLTFQNFIRVLNEQAFLDPSQMEKKVADQIQAREKAHMERNEAAKATKEQRAEKRARKLHEDTSQALSVAIFYVKDMSHTYHRTKVDMNAQQNNITGGVLECMKPPLACVICEGGPKAIKRYIRLMTVRMKWKGPDDVEAEDEEESDDDDLSNEGTRKIQKFNPDNKCELVWTGMSLKRLFSAFAFQSCETSDVARKVLASKGVGHYWDQVISQASGRGAAFHLKLIEDQDDVETS